MDPSRDPRVPRRKPEPLRDVDPVPPGESLWPEASALDPSPSLSRGPIQDPSTAEHRGAPRNLKQIYRKDGILIAHSAAAGAVSFPASWAVSALAGGELGTPFANAAIGVVTSLGVYLAVFYGLSLWRARNDLHDETGKINWSKFGEKFIECIKILGLKEASEMGIRFGLHAGLMATGLSAMLASPIAQGIAGGAGHLATPLLANIGRLWRDNTRINK